MRRSFSLVLLLALLLGCEKPNDVIVRQVRQPDYDFSIINFYGAAAQGQGTVVACGRIMSRSDTLKGATVTLKIYYSPDSATYIFTQPILVVNGSFGHFKAGSTSEMQSVTTTLAPGVSYDWYVQTPSYTWPYQMPGTKLCFSFDDYQVTTKATTIQLLSEVR